jgi:hypothetical protein
MVSIICRAVFGSCAMVNSEQSMLSSSSSLSFLKYSITLEHSSFCDSRLGAGNIIKITIRFLVQLRWCATNSSRHGFLLRRGDLSFDDHCWPQYRFSRWLVAFSLLLVHVVKTSFQDVVQPVHYTIQNFVRRKGFLDIWFMIGDECDFVYLISEIALFKLLFHHLHGIII